MTVRNLGRLLAGVRLTASGVGLTQHTIFNAVITAAMHTLVTVKDIAATGSQATQ